MKHKVLLIDESLTVQKVVALSLDRARYQVLFAKNPAQALKALSEEVVAVVLVADSVSSLSASSFPKEAELRLGRSHAIPPMILIASRPVGDLKNYVGSIQKPFTPQALCQVVESVIGPPVVAPVGEAFERTDEQRLQKIFDDAFPHETYLTNETLKRSQELLSSPPSPMIPAEASAPLWDTLEGDCMEENTDNRLDSKPGTLLGGVSIEGIDALVAKRLDEMLPKIVERLVQERLDKLLAATEQADEISA